MIEETNGKLRDIVAYGWIGLLLAQLATFITSILASGIESITANVNPPAIWAMTVFTCINLLMPMAIRTFEAGAFRWVVFGLTVLYTVIFFLHLFIGQATPVVALRLIMMIMGGWATVAAFKWARLN